MDGNLNMYHTNVSAKQNTTSTMRGFVTLCQNEIVNVTANMLSMVCKDVRKEATVSTTPDSNDEPRAEISVHSFWQRLQRTFVDVRVFYPFTPSYWNQLLATTMKTTENQKKNKVQPANLRWLKWIFYSPCIYNQLWNEYGNK